MDFMIDILLIIQYWYIQNYLRSILYGKAYRLQLIELKGKSHVMESYLGGYCNGQTTL
jgi:hypothetical protein